jgi:tetratricopeptide (TPR) repeat protein
LSGQFDAAIDHVNTRIRNNPDAAMLYNQRCWLRAIAGRELDSALADCNEALKREPDSAAALDSRGLANFKLGKLNEADADYQAVLKKNEKKPSSLYVRGILRLRSGDAERGKEDLAAAEKIDPMIAARFADYGVKP